MNVQAMTAKQAWIVRHREFICGFAQGAGFPSLALAERSWLDYTQFVTKQDRNLMELPGPEAGYLFGKTYRDLFLEVEKETQPGYQNIGKATWSPQAK
jgi:hypothetical protein